MPLQDFIPALTPKYQSPYHLSPLTEAIERMEYGPVHQLVSTPPQHTKTETTLHGLVWLLDRNPTLRIGYVSYVQSFSDKQAGSLRRYASAAGLEIDKGNDARRFWRTKQGGYFVATSIGGELTGLGFDILVIDDPYKDRNAAESTLVRDKVYDWFTSAALTRLAPTGSVLIVHTRWTATDLIGVLQDQVDADGEKEWECVNLPAINENNEALWPEVRNLKWLEKQRRKLGEYDWAALYMGAPRVKGAELFGTPVRYDTPHLRDSRIVIAADTAASEKTSADFSVAVVLAVHGYEDGQRADVIDVMRMQREIPEVCRALEQLQKKWAAPIHVESKGVGKAVPQVLRMINPNLDIREITGEVARGDKFARAQPASAAWNAGRIRVPINESWVIEFLKEVQAFTGISDRHDDQVDALSYAWNVAAQSVSPGTGTAPWHDEDVNQADLDFAAYMTKREETLYRDVLTSAEHTERTKHTNYGFELIEWAPGQKQTIYVCRECYHAPRGPVVQIATPVDNEIKAERGSRSIEYLNKALIN